MKQGIYKVLKNERLTESVYRMILEGDTSDFVRPGQFINLTVEGCYLRRPISVYDWDESTVTIIYKVVGEGTEKMSQWAEGYECDVLTGLGNGFDVVALQGAGHVGNSPFNRWRCGYSADVRFVQKTYCTG